MGLVRGTVELLRTDSVAVHAHVRAAAAADVHAAAAVVVPAGWNASCS